MFLLILLPYGQLEMLFLILNLCILCFRNQLSAIATMSQQTYYNHLFGVLLFPRKIPNGATRDDQTDFFTVLLPLFE
jgi:hypothetical protein